MLFIAKKRWQDNEDGTRTDLAPQGARMDDNIYLAHIELASDTEGVILATSEDDLLNNPLVLEKMDKIAIADAVLADLEGV